MSETDRNPFQSVSELKQHLVSNLEVLNAPPSHLKLSPEAIVALKQHLQEEIDFLEQLPSETPFLEVINAHFQKVAQRYPLADL